MNAEIEAAADTLIRLELEADLGSGDRTSRWSIPAGSTGEARIVAREDGLVCGTEVVTRVFHAVDPDLEVVECLGDGVAVTAGETVVRVSGRLRSILAAERTALNFLARMSGVAALTARYLEAVAGTGCRVSDTRKTTPGWRLLEKYAVATGGGMNHRRGLYDMVLIKENHIRAAGGVTAAIGAVRSEARREGLEIEVEVTDAAELEEALACAPDRVMLDNMTVAELTAAVEVIRARPQPHPLVEASGGARLDTVRDIARTGVDYISVGALTHSAPAMDYSLLVTD